MSEPLNDALDYIGLADLLHRIGYPEPPAGYHGLLCGALCAEAPDDLNPLSLLEEAHSQPVEGEDLLALRQLRDDANAALLSDEMIFTPLLPDDEVPLASRVEQLAAWCGGFLYGLSSRRKLDLRQCSEEVRETLKDFSEFTQAGFDASGDRESEEAAYSELVEYVRVGAQLLFLELRPRPPSVDNPSTTVH
jgi:uncharacterized protein YgfB (UPF0149 family)